jgi:hypothetical protein
VRLLLAFPLVVLFAACATTYQPESFSGGFSETQLDANVFRVSFQGNGFTRPDRAEDLALLRSAELTLKSGFTHFSIVDGHSRTDYSAFTTPIQSTTTGATTSFGNTTYLNAQTRQTGGNTFIAVKPSTTNTIICFTGKPANGLFAYDAQFVFNSLSAKYGVTTPAK